MADNDYFILTDYEYNSGFMLDEYNGVYSLVEARLGQDKDANEVIYKKWGYTDKREKGDDGKYVNKPGKKRPWGVALGTRDEAIERLREILGMLGDELPGPECMDIPTGQPDDDVPF